jgi:hypothetical protein
VFGMYVVNCSKDVLPLFHENETEGVVNCSKRFKYESKYISSMAHNFGLSDCDHLW